jgi:hypothetical protein
MRIASLVFTGTAGLGLLLSAVSSNATTVSPGRGLRGRRFWHVCNRAGGYSNVASGIGSFAAGSHAQAVDIGSFVWSDYTVSAPVLASTAANQFLARASGGFKLFYQSASDERRYARAGLGCVVVAQRSSDEDRRRAPRRLRGARQHVENASLRDRLASLEKKVAALASEQSER